MQWGSAFASFVLPGFGHGQGGARVRMVVFALLGVVANLALVWSVWAIAASLALRLVAAIDGGRAARRRSVTADRAEWLAGAAAALGVASMLAMFMSVKQFRVPSSSMYPTLEIGDHFLVDRASTLWSSPQRGEVIVFHNPCAPERDYDKRVVAIAGDTVEIRCELLYINGVPVHRERVDAPCTYDDYDDMRGASYPRSCTRYHETLDGKTYDVFGTPPGEELTRTRDFPDPDKMPVPPTCGSQVDSGMALSPVQHAGRIVDGERPADPCAPTEHYVVPEDSLFVLGDNRSNSNDSRYWGVVPLELVVGRAIGVVYPRVRDIK